MVTYFALRVFTILLVFGIFSRSYIVFWYSTLVVDSNSGQSNGKFVYSFTSNWIWRNYIFYPGFYRWYSWSSILKYLDSNNFCFFIHSSHLFTESSNETMSEVYNLYSSSICFLALRDSILSLVPCRDLRNYLPIFCDFYICYFICSGI